jgi:hypothetical protein
MPNSTSKISGAFKNSWIITKKGKKVFLNYNFEFELGWHFHVFVIQIHESRV